MKENLKLQIVELHSQGYNDCEIAKKLNMCSSSINRYRNNILKLPCIRYQNSYKNSIDRLKGYIIRNIKFSAKRRNIIFNLHYNDIELPEYCPVLEIKLDYTTKFAGNDFNRATVDRIDNSKGYIKGNIIIMSRLANSMKNSASFDQLLTFSKNINLLIQNYKNQDALGSITDIFPNINLLT